MAPGDCSPGAPTDPYVPFQAYGSSYQNSLRDDSLSESAIRLAPSIAIRCWFVYTVLGFDAPAMCPSNGVMTWRPLSGGALARAL